MRLGRFLGLRKRNWPDRRQGRCVKRDRAGLGSLADAGRIARSRRRRFRPRALCDPGHPAGRFWLWLGGRLDRLARRRGFLRRSGRGRRRAWTPTEGGEAVRSGLGLKASDGGGASAGVPSASPLADELAAGLAGGTSSNDAVPLRLAGGPPESAAFGRSGSAPSFRSGEPELLGPETVSSLGGGVAVGAPAGAMASGHLKRPGVKMSAKTAPTAAAANANIAAFSTRPRGRACVIASAGPGACGSTSAPAIVRPASSLVQTGAATSGLLESPAAGDAALPYYSLTYRTSSHGLTSGEESASKHSSN